MKHNRRFIVARVALLWMVCVGLAVGASNGKKVKINGMITGRDGENLTLRTTKGQANVIVTLTDETKVQTPKGLFRHSEQAVTALLPGLRVEVEGTGDESKVVANTVRFNSSDLQLAEIIQAGLNPTEQQQAINKANIATNAEGVATNKSGVAANQQQGTANAAGIAANQQDIQANQ